MGGLARARFGPSGPGKPEGLGAEPRPARRALATAQAAYFLATGIWPLLHRYSRVYLADLVLQALFAAGWLAPTLRGGHRD